jgi:hypothetical protein
MLLNSIIEKAVYYTKVYEAAVEYFESQAHKPKKVKKFKAELISMSNVRLTWELPNVTPKQAPIKHTEISVRVADTLPWTVQDVVVPSGEQAIVFFDVGPGEIFYRAVIVDELDVRGGEVQTSIDVPFEEPGIVSNFIATLQ